MSDIQHAAAAAASAARVCLRDATPCFPIILLVSALSACDGEPGSFGDLLKSPSVAEINSRVEQKAHTGDIPSAIRIGEKYLSKNTDIQGDLHRTLARLYNESGDAQGAVRHLQLSHGTSAGQSAIDTPDASRSATATQSPATASPAQPLSSLPVVEVDGASVRHTAKGIEVRAGDAVANSPK